MNLFDTKFMTIFLVEILLKCIYSLIESYKHLSNILHFEELNVALNE